MAGSGAAGPIWRAVSVTSAWPYFTRRPNASSPTCRMSGAVRWVRSTVDASWASAPDTGNTVAAIATVSTGNRGTRPPERAMAWVLALGIRWGAESEGAKHLAMTAGHQDLTLILTAGGG